MKAAAKTTDKRRIRGEESRSIILQAAVDSIAAQGLSRLTLDRVAERVGLSRGLVVFHFKSKQKLIAEVLQYLGREYSGGWNTILESDDGDVVSMLLRLIDYDIRFACFNPKYVSAWHSFWGDSMGNMLFYELSVPRDEGYAVDLSNLLAKISRDGGYGEQDLPTITHGLVVMMFGVWTQVHLNPGPDDYAVNIRAIHLYLQKMFPDTSFPGNAET
jgi:TetR/AcrR family transcriptional repressor of bet genes